MSSHFLLKLRDAIAKRDAVIVVGTGVSVATVPDNQRKWAGWVGLLLEGLERCPDLSPGQIAGHRETLTHDPGLDNLLDVATAIERRLKKHGLFFDWLTDTVGQLKAEDPTVIKAIGAMACPILTTNYDGLLGKVLGLDAVSWQQNQPALAIARGEIPGILHLHGRLLEPDSIVLGDASYQSVADSPGARMLKEALAAMRTIVFVGCGVDGVTDPDLGPVLAGYGALFKGAKHKHFWLCRSGDAGEALPDGVVALPYGPSYSDLVPFLRNLAAPSASVAPPVSIPAAAPSTAHLPTPLCAKMHGRDEDLREVTQWLVEGRRFAVTGMAGMGKSTLSLLALRSDAAAAKFGARRWFVRLDSVTDGDGILHKLGEAMGMPAEPGRPQMALADLRDHGGAMVLDNFESPWQANQGDSERALADIMDIPGVAVAVGIRGEGRPTQLAAIKRVNRLDIDPARRLFLDIAGPGFATDSHLDELLTRLDGHPLALICWPNRPAPPPASAVCWSDWRARVNACSVPVPAVTATSPPPSICRSPPRGQSGTSLAC